MRDGYLNKSDCELISLMVLEDVVALETLFNRYYPSLCKFTAIYLHNYNKAEEIIADLFMKLWDNRTSIEIKSLEKYLFSAARNAALNEIRRVKLNTSSISDHEESLMLSDGDLNPQEILTSRESYKEIFDLIHQLPDRQREVLLMSRIELLEKEKISELLGITIRTVETLLYQAVKNFRALIFNVNHRSKI